jgi:hypothetical protein
MHCSVLIPPTTPPAILGCPYLLLWQGTIGDMVSEMPFLSDHILISDLSGVPVAWMLSSNSQNETIAYFLHLIKSWNPEVRPAYLMTDCDQAQISALEAVYPQSQVLLCTWHVLHAIQSHFWINHFLELWTLVKKLVHTSDLAEFTKILDKISSDPAFPQSFTEYFSKQWVPMVHMWSGIGRRSQSIYEESNTNMLLEG